MPKGVELLSGVQERLGPLRTWLFPPQLYLQLADEAITAMALDGRRIIWLERVPLPQGLCEDGQVLRSDSLADLLGDLLVARGFAGARVAAVLPASASQWREVRWPGGRWPDDPERILALNEAELHLESPLAYLDLHLIDLEREDAASIVVTVPTKVLESWIEVFAIAGISLERMESAKVCACRALQPLLEGGAPAGAPIGVLQVEPRRTSLTLLDKGVPVYERRLPGSDQVAELIDELKRFNRFWREFRPGRGTPRLFLHGSGLHDADPLVDQLAVEGFSAELIDPLAKGWLVDQAPDPDKHPAGPALAPLWGLAAAEVTA